MFKHDQFYNFKSTILGKCISLFSKVRAKNLYTLNF
jgi:hypothetical protein